MSATAFADAFLDAVADSKGVGAPGRPGLEEVWEEARAAHPSLALGAEPFARYLAARLPEAEQLEQARQKGRLGDLWLCCACLENVPGAHAALDARHLRAMHLDLSRAAPEVGEDEAKQLLRHKLLLAAPGQTPRLAEYRGQGDLRRWLKAVAVRAALDLRKGHREVPVDDELVSALRLSTDHPELAHLKRQYKEEFKAAFAEAVATLPAREQLFLRQYHLDGVRLEKLAALHRVAASTISRSLAKSRGLLLKRVRASLMQRMRMSAAEVDSVVRLIQSQLSLPGSLKR